MHLTNWLQQLLSRSMQPATRRARAIARIRERAWSRGQRRIEHLEPRTVLVSDFGDAPDTNSGTSIGNYQTLAANGGPSHVIDSTQTKLFLGARVDGEANATPNNKANGDDRAASSIDDEDGLVDAQELSLTVGASPVVRIRATNTTGSAATLYGWIDYNRDGVFANTAERTSVAVPAGTSNRTFSLAFPTLPLSAVAGATFARFRLSADAAAANPIGAVTGGEVEDYAAAINLRRSGAVDDARTISIANDSNGGPSIARIDYFGSAVASLGDINGDGVIDLAVGARRDDTNGSDLLHSDRGAMYVLMMNANGTAKSSVKLASGTNGLPVLADRDYFGSSAASLGDLDGDGVTELAVGAHGDKSQGEYRGAAYILFLNSNGTVKSSVKIGSGLNGGPQLDDYDAFGSSVTSMGDFDGDGVADLAVAAKWNGTGMEHRGAVYLLQLNSNGTAKGVVKLAHGVNGVPQLPFGSYFGQSLASLGDIDSDSITDLAVASGEGAPNMYQSTIHLLRLNADGTVKSTLKLTSGTNGAPVTDIGGAISRLGDLDGDGIHDLMSRAIDSNGNPALCLMSLNSNGTVKSSVLVSAGINGGPQLGQGTGFGDSMTSVGDLDGDGLIDLAIGARSTSANTPIMGAVQILFSRPQSIDFGDAPDTTAGTGTGNYQTALANGGPSHVIDETRTSLYLGTRVDSEANALSNTRANGDDVATTLNDEDGLIDAIQDLIVNVGAAPVVRVRATNTTGTVATLYGWIDYNRDGVFDNASERASAAIPTATNNGTFLLTFPTPSATTSAGPTYARFRLSADAAAANATGPAVGGEVEDYSATIAKRSTGIIDSTKTKKIASGLNGAPVLTNGGAFGNSVAATGDLNGDGVADLIVGHGAEDNGRGAVRVLFMNANGTVKSSGKISHGLNGGPNLTNEDLFGSAVTSLGDLNGDGVTDVAVGAMFDDTGATDAGAVYVLFMNANGTAKSSRKIATNTNGGPSLESSAYFGVSIAAMGDLDGDGIVDLAVGAEQSDISGSDRGAVYLLLLNTDGTVKNSRIIASGISGGPALANEDHFGVSVTSLGDLNGDGITDLAVGAYRDDTGGPDRGAVHVLLLNSNGTVKSSTKVANGTNGGPVLTNAANFGGTVASLGDLDGDGVTDLGVASDDGRGVLYILLLNANGSAKSTLKLSSGTNGVPALAVGDYFGTAVAPLGDLDGDGVTDLAFGAFGDDTGGPDRGAVYVAFLKALPDSVNVTVSGSESIRVVRTGDNVEVRINNVVDSRFTIPATTLRTINIQGGTGNNVVDLSAINSVSFPSLVGITVSGNNGDDSIIGSTLADTLSGDAGNDTVAGGDGGDVLSGGAGTADVVVGSTTTNLMLTPTQLSTGPGNAIVVDALSGFEKALLTGSAAVNVLDASASAMSVTMLGGGGNDILIGGNLADSLDGQDGSDILTGGWGSDTLVGGAGGDILREVAYTDSVSGQTRTITLTNALLSVKQGSTTLSTDSLSKIEFADLSGGTMRDVLNASAFTSPGVVSLSGGGGNDVITGTSGVDLILAASGADSISGGGGNDTIISGAGNDTISGGDGDDNLSSQAGNDSILGDAGNDAIVGGAGIDTLSGGAGNDFLSGQTEAGLLSGGDGNDTLQGHAANDTLHGDLGDDRLYGVAGDDVITGGDGLDSLLGGAGNDSLNGGAGADTLQGDIGNDALDGGAGFDRINEILDTNVTISSVSISTSQLGVDGLVAVERIQLSGGASNNLIDARQATVPLFLFGGVGNDTLLGGSKSDGLAGGDGDDVLSGGADIDIIDGGNGNDYWSERANGDFTVNGMALASVATGSETPISIERIVLIGGDGANKLDASLSTLPVVLIGGRGNDTLLGGTLADTISGGNRGDATVVGGDGVDSLNGGAGSDVFENDAPDTKVTGAGDTSIADIFTLLPNWIDVL